MCLLGVIQHVVCVSYTMYISVYIHDNAVNPREVLGAELFGLQWNYEHEKHNDFWPPCSAYEQPCNDQGCQCFCCANVGGRNKKALTNGCWPAAQSKVNRG